MRKLAVITLISLLGTWLPPIICKAQTANEVPTLSRAQWRQDLQYFARELPRRHANAFHSITREQFERAVGELDAAIPSLQDHQIIVRMLQITARVGDAHTYIHLPDTFRRYPLSLYWFGNELRVIRATADYRDALGARVVKIGDMNISDVQARLLSVHSQSENEWFILHNSPLYMMRPEVLHTLGIVPDAGRAMFTFENDQGRQFTLEIVPVASNATLDRLNAAREEPLFRQRPNEQFWFTYLSDSQTVYVSFRSYNSFGDNVRRLFDFIERNPTQKLVIDMRQNGGGDFTKVRRDLIPRLRRLTAINRRGHLFVIIGRRTFSAAMVNAIDFRRETNAILVGEPAGERPNGYQENDEMRLPNSRLTVSYSTRLYRFLEQDAPAVMPDQRVDPNWADYQAGRDPVMGWILSYRSE